MDCSAKHEAMLYSSGLVLMLAEESVPSPWVIAVCISPMVQVSLTKVYHGSKLPTCVTRESVRAGMLEAREQPGEKMGSKGGTG